MSSSSAVCDKVSRPYASRLNAYSSAATLSHCRSTVVLLVRSSWPRISANCNTPSGMRSGYGRLIIFLSPLQRCKICEGGLILLRADQWAQQHKRVCRVLDCQDTPFAEGDDDRRGCEVGYLVREQKCQKPPIIAQDGISVFAQVEAQGFDLSCAYVGVLYNLCGSLMQRWWLLLKVLLDDLFKGHSIRIVPCFSLRNRFAKYRGADE